MTTRQHHSLDAEASVLGGILNDAIFKRGVLKRLDALEVDDFVSPKHQAVFMAIRNLEMAGTPIDAMTVGAELERIGRDTAVGGFPFLADLTLRVPSQENVEHYAAVLVRLRLSREVLKAASEIIAVMQSPDNAGDDEYEGEGAVQWATARVQKINTRTAASAITIGAAVKQRFVELERIAEERATGKRTLTGYTTGIERLDAEIGGVQPGIVSIVAARPGMGKSSAGLAIADANSAAHTGVHVFSLEDTRASYADRTVSRESGVPAEKLRRCDLNRSEMGDVGNAGSRLWLRRGWLLDDRSGLTATEIVRSVRREAEKNGTKVVIVDYLQLVRKVDARQSTHEHLAECVTTFADAAKNDQMAYVVMSQLNRGVEQRSDKRPQLADLRESGAIEERAKLVVFLYRGFYYGPEPVKGIDYDQGNAPPSPHDFEHTVQLLIAKNSNGPTGRVFARWDGPTTRVW